MKLTDFMPQRVLPIATLAPLDIDTLFRFETIEIKKLLLPKSRKGQEAFSRLRPLCILDAVLKGEKNTQPSEKEISAVADKIKNGESWTDIFKGVSAISIDKDGDGPSISLKISKKADVEIQLVRDDPNAAVVAVKRVNELDYYNLGLKQLVTNIKVIYPFVTGPKLLKLINHLNLQKNPDLFKEIIINSQCHKRYSRKAQDLLVSQIPIVDLESNWRFL